MVSYSYVIIYYDMLMFVKTLRAIVFEKSLLGCKNKILQLLAKSVMRIYS